MHPSRLFPRRSMLQAMMVGAGGLVLEPLLRAQTGRTADALTARIQTDLEKHAGFGIKRSATPGDLQTAEWIATRLKAAGYKVDAHDFPAPFFVERSVGLSTEGMSLNLYPQTPAATTGAKGVTGRLALLRTQAEAATTRARLRCWC